MSRFRVVVMISAMALALGQSAKAQTSQEQAAGAKQATAQTAATAGTTGQNDLAAQVQELRKMIEAEQATIKAQQDKMDDLAAQIAASKEPAPVTIQPAVYSGTSTLAVSP